MLKQTHVKPTGRSSFVPLTTYCTGCFRLFACSLVRSFVRSLVSQSVFLLARREQLRGMTRAELQTCCSSTVRNLSRRSSLVGQLFTAQDSSGLANKFNQPSTVSSLSMLCSASCVLIGSNRQLQVVRTFSRTSHRARILNDAI